MSNVVSYFHTTFTLAYFVPDIKDDFLDTFTKSEKQIKDQVKDFYF